MTIRRTVGAGSVLVAAMLALAAPAQADRCEQIPNPCQPNQAVQPVEPPTITGEFIEGRWVNAHQGMWTFPKAAADSAPETHFTWYRCTSATSCTAIISGAGMSRYQLRTADVGYRMRVRVTYYTTVGSGAAHSALTEAVIAATHPFNTALPQLSGNAVQGQALTTTVGGWVGPSLSFAYAWVRCAPGGVCTVIPGASQPVYTMRAEDVGQRIHSRITATNAYGSAAAHSEASLPVLPATPVKI
ncbi:MAG TPA: hypothetical protein VG318_14300 [Actinomycetota bacterium]|nr:hypothetical protein [Actinomycetota bacterium]